MFLWKANVLWKIQNYADCAVDAVGIVTVGN